MNRSQTEQLAKRCEDCRELFDDGLSEDGEYSYEVIVLTALSRLLRITSKIKSFAAFTLGLLIGELLLSPLIELLTK